MNRSILQVAAAIIQREGKFLITQRLEGDHLGGFWEFPGGKIEPGESFESCLERELAEELSVIIGVEKFWKKVRHAYPEKIVELHFYFCELRTGVPEPRGCQAYRWVEPQELVHFRFPPADREIIEELAKGSCEEQR